MHPKDIIRLDTQILSQSMPTKNFNILDGTMIDVGVETLNHSIQDQWKTVKIIGVIAVKYIQA